MEPSTLQRVARGDASAVQEVLDRYGPLVWSLVRRRVPADAAEDLVQEIFIDVWRSAARYDPAIASEATFLTTIARRRLIDHGRRRGARPDVAELEEEPAGAEEGPDPLELADEARVAAEAIGRLRPDEQRVLKLGLVQGLTQTEIASATGLPLGTVKSHMRRGLERVRKLLKVERETPAGSSPGRPGGGG